MVTADLCRIAEKNYDCKEKESLQGITFAFGYITFYLVAFCFFFLFWPEVNFPKRTLFVLRSMCVCVNVSVKKLTI